MAIQIKFDPSNNPEKPRVLLARKNGDIIGEIPSSAVEVTDNLRDVSEISFNVYKSVNGKITPYWEQITDFKLIYCPEWKMCLEIKVETDESTETIKTIFGKQLGVAELSQVMLFSVQINTEDDIAREDYVKPTIFYDAQNPECSLLHRILDKAPHYKITYVDSSLTKIQRQFTFDGKSIYDSLQEIADEVKCLFVFPSSYDEFGNIQRTIEVYDLESVCLDCDYRGNFTDTCPECGSKNIDEGYGEDTTIYIASDVLADEIKRTSDVDSVKNCFRLEAGDDLMTATVINCNPNGTAYIWRFSEAMKKEMSNELAEKITEYDRLFQYYNKDYVADINMDVLINYNTVVDKYKVYNEDLEKIATPIIGFPSLINAYYNTIDLALYLQSGLMPSPEMSDTTAEKEVAKLTVTNISPVAISDLHKISHSVADNAVLSVAKVLVDPRYKVKIKSSYLDTQSYFWTGSFEVTNYSDEEDTADSKVLDITIDDNYRTFVKQKLDKALKKDDTEDMSITGLFKREYSDFIKELSKYGLNYLKIFLDSCQGSIDILIEQGVSDRKTWSGTSPDLYEELYIPYLDKKAAIEAEIAVRESEINSIVGVYNLDEELTEYGLQNYIEDIRDDIQKQLNFEKYLGEELWFEFCTFRREDKYLNKNYISDGLNNAQLISNANDFVQVAQKEILKASELQHSISTTLKNLLTIDKFAPLVKYFKVGNWIRIKIDDELYKLRLISYKIQYDDIDTIEVEFSDVTKITNSTQWVHNTLTEAKTMATSYDSVKRQAKLGAASDKTLSDIVQDGISMTDISLMNNAKNQNQSWNERGMLFREFSDVDEDYTGEQLKIINSTIAMTDDKWRTTKTAIGKFFYYDPVSKTRKQAWGINGELLVGKIFIGESLALYNETGTMTFDNNGFSVTNGTNFVVIDPNSKSIFNIRNNVEDLLTFDDNGDIDIVGNITAKSLTLSEGVLIDSDKIQGLSLVALSGSYNDLLDIPEFHAVAFSGDYEELENVPVFAAVALSGKFADLIDAPDFHKVAYSGDYADLENKPLLSDVAISGNYIDLLNTPVLATVATTGSYNDLKDKPDISDIEAKLLEIEVNSQQVQVNKANIEGNTEAIDKNLNDILDIQAEQAVQNANIESVQTEIGSVKSSVSTHNSNIESIKSEIEILKGQIQALQDAVTT